ASAVPRLLGSRHQPVAEHHPARRLDLGCGRAAAEHGLHAGRRALHHSFHPRLHRMVLLCLPRQGSPRRGLPLMTPDSPLPRLWARRIGWMVLLWLAGVAVLAVVALIFRVVMNLAGMTV